MVFITSVTPASATANRNLLPDGMILLKRVHGVSVESQSGRAGLMNRLKRGFWKSPQKNITEKREKERKRKRNKTESPLTESQGVFPCLALHTLVNYAPCLVMPLKCPVMPLYALALPCMVNYTPIAQKPCKSPVNACKGHKQKQGDFLPLPCFYFSL